MLAETLRAPADNVFPSKIHKLDVLTQGIYWDTFPRFLTAPRIVRVQFGSGLAEMPPEVTSEIPGGRWGGAQPLALSATSSGLEQLVVQLLRTLFG